MSSSLTLSTSPQRYYGLDLARAISFWAITFYHFAKAIWLSNQSLHDQTMQISLLYWDFLLPVAKALTFSGFSILIITSFLLGLSEKSKTFRWPLILFLSFGWLVFAYAGFFFKKLIPYWDIYPLIALGLLISQVFEKKTEPRLLLYLAGLGFSLTLVPFWQLPHPEVLPLGIRHILVGDCSHNLANWPILPWIGLIFFGYGVGAYMRARAIKQIILKSRELVIWSGLLAVSSFKLGAFYRIQFVSDFECANFQVPVLEFWAHLIWIVFAIRVSLDPRLNGWLGRNLPVIGKLQVSQNFFLVYFYHFIICFSLGALARPALQNNAFVYVLTFLAIWPLSELFALTTIRIYRSKKLHDS